MNSKNDSHRIPVLLCFDINYANYAAVATYSAYKNSKSQLIFHWLATKDAEKYAQIIKDHLNKLGIEIELHVLDLLDLGSWKTGHHFTSTTYMRLFAPDLMLSADKAIYIDCDTLVLADLGSLYNYQLDDAYFGGVVDEGGARTSKVPRSINDKYINAGVLLMNLKGLRDDEFFERSKMIYAEYEEQITWSDQCIINKYAENRKVILDPKWNRQIFSDRIKGEEFGRLANQEVSSILHFVGAVKPWQQWCNPAISEFWWACAQDLKITNLKPTQISSVEQLISFANVLHLNSRFEEASAIKTKAIEALIQHMNALRSKQYLGPNS